MGFIKNLKIRDKLLLLLAIVLIPLVYFIGAGIIAEVKERQELKEAFVQFEESEKISQLIHEFQKERALGLGYIYSREPQFINSFQQQILKTDLARQKLEFFLQENDRNLPSIQSFNNLDNYRNQIEELTLDTSLYDNFATATLEKLTNRIQDNATGISDIEVRQRLSSYVDLLNSKVYLGKLRVNLIGLLSTNAVTYQNYSDILTYKAFYNKASESFINKAPYYIAASYQERLNNKNFQEILQVLSDLEKSPNFDFKEDGPLVTYNKFSAGVEGIKRFENVVIQDLKNIIEDKVLVKGNRLLFYFIAVFLILILAVFLSIYIINTVSRSLLNLKNAADKVSKGHTDVFINVDSRDEIGDLADSFRKLVNKNINLTYVADAIGKGHYDVALTVESEQDVLTNAIRKMKESLGKFSIENEKRNWLLSGVTEVNNLISGAVDVNETSNKVIKYLVNYTGAKLGAVYVADEHNSLLPSASYALEAGENELPVLTIGKGQVGEAALQSKTVILENVQKKFFKVKTAFSETDTLNLAIVPLVFEKNITGVIELASADPYTPQHIEFLEDAAEKIAVVFHTLKIYHKTQELLYETQNQAEEMETQQEELRQVNSELKASEEELKASQEELEEKNSELQEKARQVADQYEVARNKNREIEEARQAIELKVGEVETISKYKSEFLANMSHELRTPLNSILLLSKLLGDNPEKTLTQKQVEHLNIIYNSGNDLLKLINEVLDLSKIESGRVSVDAQEIKIKSLEVHNAFLQEAEQKNIQFNVQLASNLPEYIYTDKFRLEQILKNLLSNAFKFTPSGGSIDFSIFVPDKDIVLKSSALKATSDRIAFSVKDTGIGIPKDKQHLVFEAFQQADASTTRKFGGTGLGLAISRELASILEGEIQIESEENKGSTFTLYLPARYQKVNKENQEKILPVLPATQKFDRSIEKVAEKIEKVKPGNGKISILIIEDDRGFSNILADFAATKKFKVWQAYTGTDGIEMAKKYVPDAVLLDIQLPDINGWEVLARIKKENSLKNTQIHVMSAYDQEVIGNHEGHDEYLPKPLTLEMLDKAFVNISNTRSAPVKKILIVEDNKVENYAIAELLLAHQIQSVSALTGNEAYKLLQDQQVDCVILDLNLPDMGGYELMEKLKKSDKLSEIPIVIYSGKDLSEEEERKIKKYANTIIIKNQFSYIRLLDEVQLFLHTVNEKLPGKERFKMNLHVPEELLKDKKVLIVDDDVRNIYSLYSVLEDRSMKVVIANDGKEALEKLENEKDIDVVLMDIMMPEMDGIEATRRIRENQSLKNLPVIALTAKAMKGDREKCLEAGASDYISKPIEIDKLLTLMRVWLYDKR